MKKVLLAGCLTLALATSVQAGGLWSMAKNAGVPTKDSTAFQLEVAGVNIRGYVFDVPELGSKCISLWGEDTQQLECKTYSEINTPEG